MMELTKEEQIQAIYDLKVGYTLGHADIAMLKAMARQLLAEMEQEPVAWEVKGILCHTRAEANIYVGEPEPLYAAPHLPQPAVLSVPDERAAFETFMEKRFKDCIDRRLVKNGDGEYFAWDMQIAWIVWQGRAAMFQGAEPPTDNTNQQFESLSKVNK